MTDETNNAIYGIAFEIEEMPDILTDEAKELLVDQCRSLPLAVNKFTTFEKLYDDLSVLTDVFTDTFYSALDESIDGLDVYYKDSEMKFYVGLNLKRFSLFDSNTTIGSLVNLTKENLSKIVKDSSLINIREIIYDFD